MLIETQIRFAIPGLTQDELDATIAQACKAMTAAREYLHDSISLQEIVALKGGCIRFRFRGLRTNTEMEYVYNLQSGKLFAYNSTDSHLDLETRQFLPVHDKLREDPGF